MLNQMRSASGNHQMCAPDSQQDSLQGDNISRFLGIFWNLLQGTMGLFNEILKHTFYLRLLQIDFGFPVIDLAGFLESP